MASHAEADEVEALQLLQDELEAAEHDIASGMGLASQDVPHVREVLIRLIVLTWKKAQSRMPKERMVLPSGVRGEAPFDDEKTPILGPFGHQKNNDETTLIGPLRRPVRPPPLRKLQSHRPPPLRPKPPPLKPRKNFK